MDLENSNYFTYKRNRINSETEQLPRKRVSKLNFLFQIFFATFIIIFIILVIAIMKYSSKIDIEYPNGELSRNNSDPVSNISGYGSYNDDVQMKIDKRLVLIQQEENAPSEAKIITEEKNNIEDEIIDPSHIETSQRIDKIEKQKIQNKSDMEEKTSPPSEIKLAPKKQLSDEIKPEKNITIMSKVLIGRFSTFEDAQKIQSAIKSKDSSLSPFVKKIGDVFAIQMGSYQDFSVAKTQAQNLKAKGYDVWIYQQ